MEIGTFCKSSVRFSAVTVTTSRTFCFSVALGADGDPEAEVASWAKAGCAALDNPIAATPHNVVTPAKGRSRLTFITALPKSSAFRELSSGTRVKVAQMEPIGTLAPPRFRYQGFVSVSIIMLSI